MHHGHPLFPHKYERVRHVRVRYALVCNHTHTRSHALLRSHAFSCHLRSYLSIFTPYTGRSGGGISMDSAELIVRSEAGLHVESNTAKWGAGINAYGNSIIFYPLTIKNYLSV